ncbi:MAG: protein translocase subunit SecD [Phycisphaerae bacterium]|nr:protein translocase subunit SecD [Phycisphaerae bacterium]
MMRNIAFKIILILIVVALCLWALYPPSEKIRLGKDLRGGVSLVYSVKMPEDAQREDVLAQVIDVLQLRVNPQGVLDISMQPQGLDRIEVVMPLPSPEVRELQKAYKGQLQELLDLSRLNPGQLEQALDAGNALEQFGGDPDQADVIGSRYSRIRELQRVHDMARDSRQQLQEALAAGKDVQEIERYERSIATAEVMQERIQQQLLLETLDDARLMRALGLDRGQAKQSTSADGTPLVDEQGNPVMELSARMVEIDSIKSEFPHLAGRVDELIIAHDAYIERRTGLDDPEDLKRLLQGAGVLEFRIAVANAKPEGVNPAIMREQLVERGPLNTDSNVAAWFKVNDLKQWYDGEEQLAILQANPESYFASQRGLIAAEYEDEIYLLLYTTPTKSMTHEDGSRWSLQSANRIVDEMGRPAVSFSLDPAGGLLMSKLTGPHQQAQMAIVLDGQVYSAPTLQSRIASRGQITGNFSDDEISYLIRVLAAGSLEARLSAEPISTSILGPSIGADNLKRGLEAVLLSVIVTAIIMIIYYFFAGVVADIALCINALFVFGVMAMIDGTFTLPGLAGIALTIGMAVDANVLIYERIREEMVNYKENLRNAIRLGYQKATSAIIDGNITNLIVCFVLYKVAATEVKGFALTLSLGVLGTLFTTLFVTRVVFALYTEGFKARSLPMLPTVIPAIHRLLEPRINWISLRPFFLGFSLILAVASLVLFFSRGRDILETEFRGGVSLTMMTRDAEPGEVAGPDGHLMISRGLVEERIRQIGRDNPDDPILSELANAIVLTVGTTNQDMEASGFQVKVANPPQATDDQNISGPIEEAIVNQFESELDVIQPVEFAGIDDSDHTRFTYSLDGDRLGDALSLEQINTPIGDFRGGVGILVEDIAPSVALDEVVQRIDRMRNQPDYSSTLGRDIEVVGVEPGPTQGTWSSVAVMVYDPDVNAFDVELDTWDRELASKEWDLVSKAFKQKASLEQVSSFSPRVAENLAASAIVAIILSLLGMLAYIWIRFGSLRYSVCTIMALLFNVSVCLGALALSTMVANHAFGRTLLIEEFRIDLNVVAGLLTIIGYSLNDTIVILDRVRENRGKLNYAGAQTVNSAINQTFSRTVLTSGTTIVTALILFVLGGTGIRPFAFTFLVGLIAATYSSVAIAAPLVYSRFHDRQAPRADEDEDTVDVVAVGS